MKILLVSNGYPPHRWAGTETYTAGIAEELVARGHQVRVLCAGDWERGEEYFNGYQDEERNGVLIRRLNFNWLKSPDPSLFLYNNPVVADYLSTYLKENRPNLVHVTSCETLTASVLRVVKDADIPLVLSLTDFWFLCPRNTLLRSNDENCDGITTSWDCLRCMFGDNKALRWPRKMLSEKNTSLILLEISKYPIFTSQRGLRGMAINMADRKSFLHQAFRLADYHLTASQFVHDVFVANGFDAPIQVQPYGHDLAWRARYKGKTPADVVRLGFIGQIIPSKGVHILIKAMGSLTQDYQDRLSLFVYGNLEKQLEYGSQLKELAATTSNVHFCGTYGHEDSATVFENIDVLVVPSLWYDFPLIIFEAFATNTPVIATNIGGMAEAVEHGSSGLQFERGDVGDLARQIKRLVEEPGLLDALRAQIPPVKTIAEEIDELERIYREIVEENLSIPT
jgi:glycosyltransferase involved in cell wall biosynthesis